MCKHYKPTLCVGGHIHDHYGKKKLGKTTVINVGYGRDKLTLVTIKNGKVIKVKLLGKKK